MSLPYKKEICTCHPEKKPQWIVKHLRDQKLCFTGNQERLKQRSTPNRYIRTINPRPPLKTPKKAPITQIDIFRELYEEQNHLSRISGKLLLPPGTEHFHWQGSHLLPKGKYPEHKLNKENIWMITQEEHEDYTNEVWRETYPEDKVEDIMAIKRRLTRESYAR